VEENSRGSSGGQKLSKRKTQKEREQIKETNVKGESSRTKIKRGAIKREMKTNSHEKNRHGCGAKSAELATRESWEKQKGGKK